MPARRDVVIQSTSPSSSASVTVEPAESRRPPRVSQ